MQGGDLEAAVTERLVIIIEGVLCNVRVIEGEKSRWRKAPPIAGYHINWYEVPLKRTVFIKERFPQFQIEAVTFISQEFLDEASSFMSDARIPIDSADYIAFDRFVYGLRFQDAVRAIYDSDPARLDRYGQLGVQVQPGMDF